MSTWLRGEGFTVEDIGDTHLAVFARGTVTQVQTSFRATMGLVTINGVDRAVVQSAPSLPTAIAARLPLVSAD